MSFLERRCFVVSDSHGRPAACNVGRISPSNLLWGQRYWGKRKNWVVEVEEEEEEERGGGEGERMLCKGNIQDYDLYFFLFPPRGPLTP